MTRKTIQNKKTSNAPFLVDCFLVAAMVQVVAMAAHFVSRYAGTEADFCIVAEDNYKCSTALRRDEN